MSGETEGNTATDEGEATHGGYYGAPWPSCRICESSKNLRKIVFSRDPRYFRTICRACIGALQGMDSKEGKAP